MTTKLSGDGILESYLAMSSKIVALKEKSQLLTTL